MNWEALGSIAELIGALAVFMTLIYLSIQIRQNTRSMDESRKLELARNRTQIVQLRSDWMLSEATSDKAIDIYTKLKNAGYPDPKCLEILSAEERAIYIRFQNVNLLINSNAKYQFEQGLIDEKTYESSRRVIGVMSPIWEQILPKALIDGVLDGDA